eukprot:TRINITY_DN3088_c0_g3_i1.p1 TRINITY_DN3088_c0_g3~~TRINITY_DN3088_c0_g3_i1.p1  ORF type:complete len:316 (-),score=71.26 TRINITY_DN3088_c0_g3_i1:70-1017(-)
MDVKQEINSLNVNFELSKSFLTFNGDSINSINYSPDGKYVGVASSDTLASVIICDTYEPYHFINNKDIVYDIVFSPDSVLFAICSGKFLKIFYSKTGICLYTFENNSEIYSISFMDNNCIISADDTGFVTKWDVVLRRKVSSMQISSDMVWCISNISKDNFFFAEGNGELQKISSNTLNQVCNRPVEDSILSLALNNESSCLAVGFEESGLSVYSCDNLELLFNVVAFAQLWKLQYCVNDQFILGVSGQNGILGLWSSSNGNFIKIIDSSLTLMNSSFSICSNTSELLVGNCVQENDDKTKRKKSELLKVFKIVE